MKKEIIEIHSRDYWFKVVENMQQNWALIDIEDKSGQVRVFFFDDDSGVFDEMTFLTIREAKSGLDWNGFERFADNKEAQEFFRFPPEPPFWRTFPHRVYSSGQFWDDDYSEYNN